MFRLSPGPLGVVIRYTLRDFANRRYLWWLCGLMAAFVLGLAFVGRYFPLEGFDTQEKIRLAASGGGQIYVYAAIIVIGLAVIRPDIDSGAAALVLTRPVSRAEFVVGRYLGSALTLIVTVVVMGLGSFMVAMAGGQVDPMLLYAFMVLALNGAVVLALMTLLAIWTGTVGAAILGIITYYISLQISTILVIVRADIVTGQIGTLLHLIVFFFPHMLPSPLVAGQEAYIGDSVFVLQGPAWYDVPWALAWIVGSLALAVWEMRRREL